MSFESATGGALVRRPFPPARGPVLRKPGQRARLRCTQFAPTPQSRCLAAALVFSFQFLGAFLPTLFQFLNREVPHIGGQRGFHLPQPHHAPRLLEGRDLNTVVSEGPTRNTG